MKNLKRLTKAKLRSIEGGAAFCPPPAKTCEEWRTWTPQQQLRCQNWILDPDPC